MWPLTAEQVAYGLKKIESKITETMDNMKPGDKVPGYIQEATRMWMDIEDKIQDLAYHLDIDDLFTN